MNKKWKRIFGMLVLGVTVFFLSCIILETAANARAGGGRSSGSRGFSSGSRSSGSTYNSSTTRQPTTPQQTNTSSPGRSFLYGLGGGLAGSMIGSMLFGRSGYAGTGGQGGGFGFGDIIILLIIAGVLYFVYKRYKAKKQMQMGASSPAGYSSYAYNEQPAYDYGNTGYTAQPAGSPVSDGLRQIADQDPSFNQNTFCEKAEDLFFKIQGGWTRRDLTAISDLLTPQMRDTFQADINRYAADKKINRLENIAVRQVEIVDAVQDQGEEYITVRYTASLLDFITDESGNVLSGSSTDPVKFLEYWTYTRKVGTGGWRLAAITQEQDYR
ncbi:MAG: import inner rane translocase, subunit Tim44 [Deltaproteobacteria bacterium]|nr:import inner rane translocase, subunit Tim44 [Deltaproteobacteria bacterium]